MFTNVGSLFWWSMFAKGGLQQTVTAAYISNRILKKSADSCAVSESPVFMVAH